MRRKKFEVAIYGEHLIRRLQTMTDAILSIIATIMVLQIPLPVLMHGGQYKYVDTFVALIIFFVSFLVIMSFFFNMVKFFQEIRKITGWQVFAFTFYLFAVSLFPFMTQAETVRQSAVFLIIYIVYVVLLSRGLDLIRYRILRFNELPTTGLGWRLRWDTLVVSGLAILLGILQQGELAGILMVYIPVRSLFRSVVLKD